MRKALLLIFITAFIKTQAQTSVYHPFPDSNAYWNCNFGGACSTLVFFDHNYTYTIISDTTIGAFNYHKLWVPAIVITDECWGNTVTSGYYAGAYRQDNANRKVYFVPPSSSAEKLLYDFNLNVGDTLN